MRSGYRIASASALFCAWRCLRPVPADAADSAPTDLRGDRGWFADNGQRATAYRVLGFGPQDGASLASVRGIAPAWLRSAGSHQLGFGPRERTALASVRSVIPARGSFKPRGCSWSVPQQRTTDNGQRTKDEGHPTSPVFLRHLRQQRHGLIRQRVTTTVFESFASTYASRPSVVSFLMQPTAGRGAKAGQSANLVGSASSSKSSQLAVASFCTHGSGFSPWSHRHHNPSKPGIWPTWQIAHRRQRLCSLPWLRFVGVTSSHE